VQSVVKIMLRDRCQVLVLLGHSTTLVNPMEDFGGLVSHKVGLQCRDHFAFLLILQSLLDLTLTQDARLLILALVLVVVAVVLARRQDTALLIVVLNTRFWHCLLLLYLRDL
jgi:hypothetical protein